MVAPLVAGLVVGGISLAGSMMSAAGQKQQLDQAKGMAQYNAGVALKNARMAEAAAKLNRYRDQKAAGSFMARQRVAYAKAGVRSTGTPYYTAVGTQTKLEMDLQINYFNSMMEATRFASDATMWNMRAANYGREAKTAPLLTIAGGVIKAAGTASSFSSGLAEGGGGDPTKLMTGVRDIGTPIITTGRG